MIKENKKQIGFFYSAWIILLSLLSVANTCIQSITRGFFGKVSRTWVDSAMQSWTKRIMHILDMRCTVYNPNHVTAKVGQPTIIMCNHSSLFDIPLSFYAFPTLSLRMLAKKELHNLPLMGKGMRNAEFPSVDRKNRHQAIKDLEVVRKLLESGIIMWIAPEGTRSSDGHVGPFKKGAFITAIQAQATIIPIGIRGAFDVLPARTHRITLGVQTEVHIGQPIDAAQFTLENKEDLIHEVRESIKALAGE